MPLQQDHLDQDQKAKTQLLGVFGASCGKTWVYLKHPAANLVGVLSTLLTMEQMHEAITARRTVKALKCRQIYII